MRAGELSNKLAPITGVRFERLLKTEEGKLNRQVKEYIHHLMSGSGLDVNIYLITTGNKRKAMSFCYKWGVPYTQIVEAESLLEIPDIVNANKMLMYYDLDRDVVQNVNSRAVKGVKASLWTLVED